MEHFMHDHPLILNTVHTDDDGMEYFCNVCEQPIWGSAYGCERCMFFLHKLCAELPQEMTHPFHPDHPLTLLSNPPSAYNKCICDVCRKECDKFIYHCSPCQFDIDIKCASVVLSVQESIQHPSHPHPLIPLQKPSMFLCDACGTEHRGSSYLCTTCGFWINQKCAESPPTIKLNVHRHTLSLIYSFALAKFCEICQERVYRRNWVYYCCECDSYAVHLNCATSEIEPSKDFKTEIESHDLEHNPIQPDSGLLGTARSDAELSKIYLPQLDASPDMMTQFIKKIGIHGKYKEATEIKHACHEHPLTFSSKKTLHDSCSTSNLPLLNETKNDEKCNGCAGSISSPFYHCVQCNFFLHEWCAELPNELRHPCHQEHPLFLTSNIFGINPCACCKLHCNVFVFTCFTCGFTLDSKCASLPRVIKHEAHKHNLALKRTSSSSCKACNSWSTFTFDCQGCKFNLCIRCALLPGTINHRYDEHPFMLTYSPLAHQTDDDLCELCEEGIDSNQWFYHCRECNQYLHTKCIIPVDEFSNLKHGNTSNIESHLTDSVALGIGTSNFEPSRDCKAIIKAEDHFLSDMLSLPLYRDSVDPITQIVEDLGLQRNYNDVTEIKHDSHEHTLIKHIDDTLNRACNGCGQIISTPFYCCDQCNYSLHQWCAELPSEMRHPCHRKHLLLFTANSDPYKCRGCDSLRVAFGYRCSTCEFALDSGCASLPGVIRHEAHKHFLYLRLGWPPNCCSCGSSFKGFAFVCSPCHLKLCITCALSPRTIMLALGDQPFTLINPFIPFTRSSSFTLTYPSLKDQVSKYDCGFCRKEINPKLWFYHRYDGERSCHMDCFRSDYWNSNRYIFTLTVRIDNHPHLLLSVRYPKGCSQCRLCSQRWQYHTFVYACRRCDFWMHDHCVRALLFGKSN